MVESTKIPAEPGASRGIVHMLHGLNTLRTFATLLVILGHAAIPYMATPIRTLIWPVHDAERSIAFDLLGLWTSGFVMPLFFLMSGISAGPASLRSSAREFIGVRAVRLFKPFLFASLVIMPVCYAIFGLGMLLTERVTMNQVIRLQFTPELQPHMFGPAHLWFLEYLLIVSIAWCVLTHAAKLLPQSVRAFGDRVLTATVASPLRPLATAACVLALLAFEPDTCMRIQNSFIPDPYRLLYYGIFFTVGAWIARLPNPVAALQVGGRWYALVWPGLFALLAPIALRHLEQPVVGWQRTAMIVLAACSGSTAVFALLAFGAGAGNRKIEWVKYFSEASFWTYLFHVPVVAAAQVAVLGLNLPSYVKFLLSAIAATVLSLVTFEYCVRYSRVGLFVLGVKKRAGTKGIRPELGWMAVAACGIAVVLGCVWNWQAYFFQRNLHRIPEHGLVRSNRMPLPQFQAFIRREGIRTVVITAVGGDHEAWFKERHDWCDANGVVFRAVEVKDDVIPPTENLVALADILQSAPRPVLLEGHRAPAQSGLGAAFAILMEGGSPEEALHQFDRRYFQLEGPEHCLLAKLIHEYRRELAATGRTHQPQVFREWLTRPHTTEIVGQDEPAETLVRRRAAFGSPRYPLQMR